MQHREQNVRRRRPDNERGAITLEFVGTMVAVLLMVLFAWQGLLAMHALSQANSAARDAARAETLYPGDGETAGKSALSQSLQDGSTVSCPPPSSSITCTARVKMPVITNGLVGDVIPPVWITREATMPNLEAH